MEAELEKGMIYTYLLKRTKKTVWGSTVKAWLLSSGKWWSPLGLRGSCRLVTGHVFQGYFLEPEVLTASTLPRGSDGGHMTGWTWCDPLPKHALGRGWDWGPLYVPASLHFYDFYKLHFNQKCYVKQKKKRKERTWVHGNAFNFDLILIN